MYASPMVLTLCTPQRSDARSKSVKSREREPREPSGATQKQLRRHRKASEGTRRHREASAAHQKHIRSHNPKCIRSHPKPSEAIRSLPKPSEKPIREAHRKSIRLTCEELRENAEHFFGAARRRERREAHLMRARKQSEAPPEAIRRHRNPSEGISSHPKPSEAISSHAQPCAAMRSHAQP